MFLSHRQPKASVSLHDDVANMRAFDVVDIEYNDSLQMAASAHLSAPSSLRVLADIEMLTRLDIGTTRM